MTEMTTAASVPGNQDAPIADVGSAFGPTELAHYLVILGGILGSTTGHTFGLTTQANNLAPLLILIGVISLGIYRGVKHHGATKWNAQVYMSQLEHVAMVAVAAPGSAMTKLTLGLQALNGGVKADFPAKATALVEAAQSLPLEQVMAAVASTPVVVNVHGNAPASPDALVQVTMATPVDVQVPDPAAESVVQQDPMVTDPAMGTDPVTDPSLAGGPTVVASSGGV